MRLKQHDSLDKAIERLGGLDPVEAITELDEIRLGLLESQQLVADLRRRAVRTLRSEGWTLKQIADATGLTTGRISQIETGFNRKERQARAAAR